MSLAGDLDLVVGEMYGSLIYMENTGTSTAPAFVQRTGSANPFDSVYVGDYSTPALGDLDSDGTLMQCPSIDGTATAHFSVARRRSGPRSGQ